jgi:Tol biopolymer transport system component
VSEYPQWDETDGAEPSEPVEQESPEPEALEPPAQEVWEPESAAPEPATPEPAALGPAAPMPAVPAPGEPEAPKRRVSRKTVWTIVGVILGLSVACVVAVVLFARPYVVGSKAVPIPSLLMGERILVAFASRGGDDLYLLQLDQEKSEGLLLAEDVTEPAVTVRVVQGEQAADPVGGSYGGFVPGRDWLLVWHATEDISALGQMNSRSSEPVDVLDSKGDRLYGYVFPKRDTLFLVESREGRSRCYVARPNGEAERIARADTCDVSRDGSTVILQETYSDETMLSAVGIKGGRETVLLDDVVGVESYRVAADGSQVAYVVTEEGDQRLLVVDRRSGEETNVSDKVHAILDYAYAPGGDTLYYVAQENAGDAAVQLYLSTGARQIAQGGAIEARFTPDSKYVVYVVVDDVRGTLHVDPLGEGEQKVVLSEEGIAGFDILRTSPPKIVLPVVKGGGLVVYTADLDGSNVLQVLDTGAEAVELERIRYVPEEAFLYVDAHRTDGGHVLYVVPVDGAESVPLLEGWAQVDLLNRSSKGEQLVFQGWGEDGDSLALYAIAVGADAQAVELVAEYQGYEDAVFTANGQSILFTARVGAERDAVDIGLVEVDGEKKPKVLYQEAFLVDVRWDKLHPFLTAFGGEQ